MKKVYPFLITCFFIIAAALTVNAQPGTLDLTFGTGGKVITPIGGLNDYGWSTALQKDGKIVVAGWNVDTAGIEEFAVTRYNINGNPDSTFGTNGKVTTDIGPYNDEGRSIVIQPDGKIIVAGYSFFFSGSRYDFALVRYNSNGSLDSTFGTNGEVTTDFGFGDDYGRKVALQNDGKIVMVGDVFNGANQDFGIVRYKPNGSLDSTFGTNGKILTDFDTTFDYATAVMIQTDSRIVVSGSSSKNGNVDFALLRYKSNGTLDSSFGTNGKTITPIGTDNDQSQSAVLQTDGKIVLVGWTRPTSLDKQDFALVRYQSNGQPDSTFGTFGKVTSSIGTSDEIGESAAIQDDGKILLAGSTYSNNGDLDFELVRYKSNGELDSTFGINGKVTTDIGGGDINIGKSVIIQTDGKIVLAGYSGSLADFDFAVTRYNGGSTVGIEENKMKENVISISPNPFTNELLIRRTKENQQIIVFDVVGKEILRVKTSDETTKINTEKLSPGFYLLMYSDGHKTLNTKLMKL